MKSGIHLNTANPKLFAIRRPVIKQACPTLKHYILRSFVTNLLVDVITNRVAKILM